MLQLPVFCWGARVCTAASSFSLLIKTIITKNDRPSTQPPDHQEATSPTTPWPPSALQVLPDGRTPRFPGSVFVYPPPPLPSPLPLPHRHRLPLSHRFALRFHAWSSSRSPFLAKLSLSEASLAEQLSRNRFLGSHSFHVTAHASTVVARRPSEWTPPRCSVFRDPTPCRITSVR